MKTLLLVDDDDDLREALADQFDMQGDFQILQAPTAGEGSPRRGAST